MEVGWPAWGAAFVGALALSGLLTPLMLRVALRRRLLDEPGGHKSHASPVPYLGGVAIALGFAAAVAVVALLDPPGSGLADLWLLLGAAVGLALVGLVDDLRGLGVTVRLLAQAGAGVAAWAAASGVGIFAVEPLNLALTVLWVVGVTNALNLLDNMDGLSAGVASVSAATLFALAALNGQFLVAGLAAAVAGTALGFLRHNFHPARIYMGDAGSLFLGFLLAVLAARLRLTEMPQATAVFVPVLALGVPIFDTTLVVINRLRHGISPFTGGKDHTSHRLTAVGIPVPVAVLLIYLAAVGLGWLAVLLARLDLVSGLMLVAFVLTGGALVLWLLSLVPVYASSRQPQRMMRLVDNGDATAGTNGHAPSDEDAGRAADDDADARDPSTTRDG